MTSPHSDLRHHRPSNPPRIGPSTDPRVEAPVPIHPVDALWRIELLRWCSREHLSALLPDTDVIDVGPGTVIASAFAHQATCTALTDASLVVVFGPRFRSVMRTLVRVESRTRDVVAA